MPKEVFIRHKPHIMAARQQLQQTNLSAAGIEQLLDAKPIMNPADRGLIAQIVDAALDSSRWVRMVQVTTAGSMLKQLLQFGMSSAGISELQSGRSISNLRDREVLANIVTSSANAGGYTIRARIERNASGE